LPTNEDPVIFPRADATSEVRTWAFRNPRVADICEQLIQSAGFCRKTHQQAEGGIPHPLTHEASDNINARKTPSEPDIWRVLAAGEDNPADARLLREALAEIADSRSPTHSRGVHSAF
jgi:hypothetical protein